MSGPEPTAVVAALVAALVHGVAAVTAVVVMVRQRRASAAAMGWLLAIVLLPGLGVALFASLGSRKWPRPLAQPPPRPVPPQAVAVREATPTDRLLRAAHVAAATQGNRLQLLDTGEAAYEQWGAMIDGAAHSIAIETYLWRMDAVGDALLQRVAARAAAGVPVAVLVDALGTFPVRRRNFAALLAAGGQVRAGRKLLHRPRQPSAHLRNHRKMLIVDGQRCWAGGMNLGAEYLGPTASTARWVDLAFVVEGPAVDEYMRVFAADWAAAGGLPLPPAGAEPSAGSPGPSIVSVVPSGPDVPHDALYDAVFAGLVRARERIVIVTPYFIPDETLLRALFIALRGGLDVSIVVPARSNHGLANLARAVDLRALAGAGAQVLLHPKMVHAKAVIVDETLAAVGSANFDVRSFFLNSEVMLLVHDAPTVRTIAAWAQQLAAQCRPGPDDAWWGRRSAEGLVRLLSPVL